MRHGMLPKQATCALHCTQHTTDMGAVVASMVFHKVSQVQLWLHLLHLLVGRCADILLQLQHVIPCTITHFRWSGVLHSV